MADGRGHLSQHRCHYWQPLPVQVRSVISNHTQMSHYVCHSTTPSSLMAGTLYTSGRALEMLAGRSVGHQTRQNRLHRPGAPSSDRHVIATRENLAEWQRSRINITHARTRKNKTIWRGSEGGSMLSRGNGLAITVWFTFSLSSSPLEPAWQLWPPWWAPGWIIYIADGLWRRVVWYKGADVAEQLSGYISTKVHGVTYQNTAPFKSNFGSF